MPLRGVLSLAGAVDLRLLIDLAGDSSFAHDREEIYNLMGGSPQDLPLRYQAGNPGDLLPLPVPQTLLQGTSDDQIPPDLPHRWAERSRHAGSHADVHLLPDQDHMDVVDPRSAAWPTVLAQTQALLATMSSR